MRRRPTPLPTFIEEHPGDWVVKAQVLMGGRGKAGKIKMAGSASEGRSVAADIMATPMPPNRQNPRGEPITSLLVEEKLAIEKEAYCAITIDRTETQAGLHRQPLWRHGHRGGRRAASPARSLSSTSIPPSATRRSSDASWHSRRSSIPAIARTFPAIAGALYDLFFRYGAKLVEINPLALTSDGRVIASDAKVELDDDALFRHPDFDEWRSRAAARRRRDAGRARPVSGSATSAASPATSARWPTAPASRWPRWTPSATPAARSPTFSTSAAARTRSACATATSSSSTTPARRSFFINIFGGITRGDEVARGIVEAMDADDLAQDTARHPLDRDERKRRASHSRRSRDDAGRNDGRRRATKRSRLAAEMKGLS